MKRLAAVALMVVGIALPGWGQRGGGRGGGGGMGQGAAVSRGGFSMGGRSGFAGGGMVGRGGFSGGAPAFRGGTGFPARRPVGLPVRRPVYVRPVRFGAPFRAIPYSYAIPYGPSYFGPDYFDSDFYGDSAPAYGAAAQPAYADSSSQGGYDPGPSQQSSVAAPENESYRAAYRAANQGPVQPESQPQQAEAVTLVFKDGRPSEQIHNYMLSRTTLYVQDGRRREIAVANLDLAATEKVNREAGVDFQLPAARR